MTSPLSRPTYQQELRQLGRMLGRHRGFIVVLGLVGVVMGGLWGWTAPKRYSASAMLLLPATTASSNTSNVLSDRRSFRPLCTSDLVLQEVYQQAQQLNKAAATQPTSSHRPRIPLPRTWQQLNGMLIVNVISNDLLSLEARADRPQAAQRLANLWSRVVIQTIDQLHNPLDEYLEQLQEQVEQARSERITLMKALQELDLAHDAAAKQAEVEQIRAFLNTLLAAQQRLGVLRGEAQTWQKAMESRSPGQAADTMPPGTLEHLHQRVMAEPVTPNSQPTVVEPMPLDTPAVAIPPQAQLQQILALIDRKEQILSQHEQQGRQRLNELGQALAQYQRERFLLDEQSRQVGQRLNLLTTQLTTLQAQQVSQRQAVRLLNEAPDPSQPLNLPTPLLGLAGGLAGALIGIGLVMVRGPAVATLKH